MHETSLRAPAQFVNSTDMLLEVSLYDDEDASWQVLPTARGATQQNASIGEVVEEEVFEYERYVPMLGWSPNNLMPVDPNRYSRARNGSRSSSDFPSISLPRVRVDLWSGMAAANLRMHCMDAPLLHEQPTAIMLGSLWGI